MENHARSRTDSPGEHLQFPSRSVCMPVLGYELPFGTELANRYVIGSVLGKGGFGITYEARDNKLGIQVAIKEYFPRMNLIRSGGQTVVSLLPETDPHHHARHVEAFLREARILARFNSEPGIISVMDCFEANGTAYFVMQQCHGVSLETYLRDMPHGSGDRSVPSSVLSTSTSSGLSIAVIRRMMEPVLSSLHHLHMAGMIHRDISPDNLLVQPDGQMKLLDFGAACQFGEGTGDAVSVLLKQGYAPLEQYGGTSMHLGPWTDIYALGAVMYRMVVGRVPTSAASRSQGLTLSFPSASARAEQSLQQVIQKAMALSYRDRYADIPSLTEALRSAIDPTAMARSASIKARLSPSRMRATASMRSPMTRIKKGISRTAAILLLCLFVSLVYFLPYMLGGTSDEIMRKEHMPNARMPLSHIPSSLNTPIGDIRFRQALFRPGSTKRTEFRSDDYVMATVPWWESHREVKVFDTNLEALLRAALDIPVGRILVRDAMRLTRLELVNKRIINIEALAAFRNLRYLNLADNDISDISALSGLEALEVLYLQDNMIRSIEPLRSLPRIHTVNLNGNLVDDLSPLKNKASLRRLDLFYLPVRDLSPLAELSGLHELNLAQNPVSTLEPIRNLHDLTHTCLCELSGVSLDVLVGKTRMETISLAGSAVGDISMFADMQELRYVDVTKTRVTDISPLAGKRKLKELYLKDSWVKDVTPILDLVPDMTGYDFEVPK